MRPVCVSVSSLLKFAYWWLGMHLSNILDAACSSHPVIHQLLLSTEIESSYRNSSDSHFCKVICSLRLEAFLFLIWSFLPLISIRDGHLVVCKCVGWGVYSCRKGSRLWTSRTEVDRVMRIYLQNPPCLEWGLDQMTFKGPSQPKLLWLINYDCIFYSVMGEWVVGTFQVPPQAFSLDPKERRFVISHCLCEHRFLSPTPFLLKLLAVFNWIWPKGYKTFDHI